MVMYLLQLTAWTAFMAALVLWPAGKLVYPARSGPSSGSSRSAALR